jgi:dTDP-4-dehydrorhamnose reductase
LKTDLPVILITGANGQLGSEFRALSARYPGYHFLFTSRAELPAEDESAVDDFFSKNNIACCVNCAAYTAVDRAETEREQAYLVNATAAGNLAKACNRHHARLIHISTDYVFDGTANTPYREDTPVDPVNTYGGSKLKGEELVMQYDPSATIIRTSWVYSTYGNNFVKTMLRLMKEKEGIGVVNDQSGCPTYATDLAEAIMQIIPAHPQPGIYHYCNQGAITWFDFATAIRDITGSSCRVDAITTADYVTPAKRPVYSVLDTKKIGDVFGITPPQWRTSLEKCLRLLGY